MMTSRTTGHFPKASLNSIPRKYQKCWFVNSVIIWLPSQEYPINQSQLVQPLSIICCLWESKEFVKEPKREEKLFGILGFNARTAYRTETHCKGSDPNWVTEGIHTTQSSQIILSNHMGWATTPHFLIQQQELSVADLQVSREQCQYCNPEHL